MSDFNPKKIITLSCDGRKVTMKVETVTCAAGCAGVTEQSWQHDPGFAPTAFSIVVGEAAAKEVAMFLTSIGYGVVPVREG